MADERGPGRPSAYKPEFCEEAKGLCEGGATDADLALAFEVCLRTIAAWKTKHPEFREACRLGKDAADDRVEASYYQRACGYEYEAEKIFLTKDGEVVRVPYVEHVPADVRAGDNWMQNRRPHKWRNRMQHELTGEGGGPIVVKTDKDRAKALASLIAKLKEKKDA